MPFDAADFKDDAAEIAAAIAGGSQGVFDFVARKLMEQGKASASGGICKFRGKYGTKCAIGFLIPDASYEPTMDTLNSPASIPFLLQKISVFETLQEHKFLLIHLQYAHDFSSRDESTFVSRLVSELHRVANIHLLSTTALDAAYASTQIGPGRCEHGADTVQTGASSLNSPVVGARNEPVDDRAFSTTHA